MNMKVLSLVTVFLMGTFSVFAKEKTDKLLVNGKCGMCEKRIEGAAMSVKGVSKADWNKDSKELTVTWDDAKADVHKVAMAVAKAGHDTQMHKATDEAYNKLPACCHYDRSSLKAPAKPMMHEHK